LMISERMSVSSRVLFIEAPPPRRIFPGPECLLDDPVEYLGVSPHRPEYRVRAGVGGPGPLRLLQLQLQNRVPDHVALRGIVPCADLIPDELLQIIRQINTHIVIFLIHPEEIPADPPPWAA